MENNAKNKHNTTQAFVLHRRYFRETSFIIDFFTLSYGKISAIAKGIRTSKYNKSGLLIPFTSLYIEFKGKNELQNLLNVESNAQPIVLHNQALYYGLYVNDLLYRLLHKHDVHEELYKQYHEFLLTLSYTAKTHDHRQWLLCLFQNTLLQEIGYGVHWNLTYNNQEIEKNTKYFFVYEYGFVAENQIPSNLKYVINKHILCNGISLLTLYNEPYINHEQISHIPQKIILNDITKIFNCIFQNLLGNKHNNYLLKM